MVDVDRRRKRSLPTGFGAPTLHPTPGDWSLPILPGHSIRHHDDRAEASVVASAHQPDQEEISWERPNRNR
jgi:hypothetical protein